MAYELTPQQHRDRFERDAKGLKATWRQMEKGLLTGRNSKSTDATQAARFRDMKESLHALDAAGLATDRDWSLFMQVERRYVMGKEYADWAKQAGL